MRLLLLALLLGLAACADDAPVDPQAQAAIDRALAAHRTDLLEGAVVTFSFRDRQYSARHDGGRFAYERIATDSSGRTVRDVLDNEGIRRYVDEAPVTLTDEEAASAISGVNSVIYFALLPHKLNDPAVRKRYLGTTTIEGEPYDEVEVTFAEQGGGVDHEDRFVYWFHRDRGTMDYLAYRFHVDGGGTRFRKAVNVRRTAGLREANGFRFADYLNYTADDGDDHFVRIEDYEEAFARGDVTLVSEIRTEDPLINRGGEVLAPAIELNSGQRADTP